MLRFSQPRQIFSSFCSIYTRISRTLTTEANIMTENKNNDTNQIKKRPLEEETESEAKKIKTETFVRIKRKNYAILLGYLGKDYYGMQRNPGMNTIEEHLIKSLHKAELITSEAFETIQNINFQRAARTDKGVSAVRQVVSLKLPENPCKDIINKNLPEDIRVFAIKKVTKGFNSKSQCDARTYSYTMPTFAFAPEDLELFKDTKVYQNIEQRMEYLSTIDGKPYQEYRISEDTRQKLQYTLKLYEGTHNFHNFTSKVFPLDPRAKRYIMSFVAEDPFIIDNMEFITLKVKGQSFMMHQIRKMVAMAIGLLKNIVTKESFEEAFAHPKYDVPRAPSLGLMLDIVHYDYYNKRYGSDGLHETLDWAECEEEIKEFEKNKILKHVFDTEFQEKSMLDWVANLYTESFGPRDDNNHENNKSKDKEETETSNVLEIEA